MSVRRLNDAPNLTQPFTAEEWSAVRRVAHKLDREILDQDMRLTMGGEPTFVGIDEVESPQWNVEALGPIKRTRGLELIRRLRERTAPGGLLHFGQGKWYPGEALPRWAFHCISRVDGVPVWQNVDLIALEDDQFGYGLADSHRFITALTRRLQVSTENILAAFNPEGDLLITEPEPVGYILPLRRRQPGGVLAWSSQLWFPRPERLTLSYGDSPIGYRIPIEPMPFVAPDDLVYEYEETNGTPSEQEKIPESPARRMDLFNVEPSVDPLPPLSGTAETATVLIRPSLCVQVRDGKLCVFLPFVPVLADYLDLIAAVEDTCEYLGVRIFNLG